MLALVVVAVRASPVLAAPRGWPAACSPPWLVRLADESLRPWAASLLRERGWPPTPLPPIAFASAERLATLRAAQARPAEAWAARRRLWSLLGLDLGEDAAGATPPLAVFAPGRSAADDRLWLADDGAAWAKPLAARLAVAQALAFARLGNAAGRAWDADSPVETDAFWARRALAAGDAAAWVLEAESGVGDLPGPRALADVIDALRHADVSKDAEGQPAPPTFPERARLFATLDGLGFVAHLRQRAPWSAVDAAWRRPPRSTTEILHPERWEGLFKPLVLRGNPKPVCAAAGPGWTPALVDTLGELAWDASLEGSLPPDVAARVAGGWAGDRVLVCQRDRSFAAGASFAAGVVAFESPADAEDFVHTASESLARPCKDTGAACRVVREGARVRLLVGAPARAGERVLAALATFSPGRGPGRAARAGRRRVRPRPPATRQ